MSVILPGSYDPVTKGHLDIIRRAAEKYDEVYVVVFTNPKKKYMFSVEDRVRMLMIATEDLDNVLVSYSNGLVIDYMTDHEISKIIKGYRNDADLEWEKQQADWNWEHGRYETELWKCSEGLENISSTSAREALEENEPLDMLPEKVAKYIEDKINENIKQRCDSLRASLNIKPNLPTLKIMRFSLVPCRPDMRTGCFAYNVGYAGKGISIMIVGDYVESGDITFEDVTFCYFDRKGNCTEKSITFNKERLLDGSLAYCYNDSDFVISEYKAGTRTESEEQFGIRFTPKGNKRKFLDIEIVFAPHENYACGQCQWKVWAYYTSKLEYIEHNNEQWSDIPSEYVRNMILNPDDYDLD